MAIHPKILSRLFVNAVEANMQPTEAAARLGTYVLLGHLPEEVSADPAVITKTNVLPNIRGLHEAGVFLDMVCWPLGTGVHMVRLGRDANNDVVIPDVRVSHRHAQLHVTPSAVRLEDLDSSSGTTLNGVRLAAGQPHALTRADFFLLGGFELRLLEAVTLMELLVSQHHAAAGIPKVPAPKPAH